ncbi:S8 family serine peptidase [Lysobacter niastensis]|uniref:S8 family serine peptidase n=1 Tax=Lysobacter niastensis TaxID=380629 RepID=UPI001E4A86BB|nr:S8 family serine peptidase [Lysobacter niastensis]
MRYRLDGLVVAVRCVLLGTAVVMAGCGGGGGGGGNVRPSPPPATTTPPPAPPTPPPPVVFAPNPQYSTHLTLTNASSAHQAGLSGAGVRIGVVDSGVMRNHPALAPRVVANLTYISASQNNLAVDDVVGHGTAVSQIMAGTPFGAWPGGIAPGAQIVSARIIADKEPTDDGSGQGNEVDGALGLKSIHQDLINRGARIMNNSWGGLYWTNSAATAPIADEYRPFIQSNGGLVVFAAGNESRANPSSMAALPSQPGPNGTLPAADLERGWLSVVALDGTNPNVLASYSNACGVAMRYCLAAPGTVVVTGTNDTPSNPTYWRWSGTSLAAPLVSGAAALVWQAFPYFNNDLVRQTLLGTATDLGAPGVDASFGYGSLDVGKAVRGPARFDWGDVTVNFDGGTSTWANNIFGDGGLTKQGTGTLVINGSAQYAGSTRVQGGTLRIGTTITSPVTIGPAGTLAIGSGGRSSGASAASVINQGTLLLDSGSSYVTGDYQQTASARMALMVGAHFRAGGTASLAGNLHVLGLLPGYVNASREVFLDAGSVTGQFNSLTSQSNVLLTATLGYSATEAWLDITRLEVTAAAQSMSLSAMAASGAERVEDAFDRIDDADGQAEPIDGDFRTGAGAIQGVPTAQAAERTLSSLSGELHGADSAFAMMAIESNRRALEARADALLATPATGAWADGLKSQRAVSSFDVDADGWMLGQDVRYNDRLALGVAVSETEGYAWHADRYDRERNRQVEGQLYAAYDLGRGYLFGSMALGRMQRWTQREIVLGADDFRVGANYADRYATVGLQAGLPLTFDAGRVTPYAGVQALHLERDGFGEDGAAGFGLSTADSTMRATQALFGVRAAREWRAGSWLWSLQGRVEWQHLLSQSGTDINARFTALDVWSPILGASLDDDIGVFGVGLEARFGRGSRLGFDLDSRHEYGQTYTRAMATWSVGF